jgi:hypothetical protein
MQPENPSNNPRFHGLFMCLNASIEGFLNGCRPFIAKLQVCFLVVCFFFSSKFVSLLFVSLNASTKVCFLSVTGLDGCFVKLTTGQQILAATGRDGNNNIFPIAFGLVDKEDKASWCWFLSQLNTAIGGESAKFGNYTIISDRKKVWQTTSVMLCTQSLKLVHDI